MAFPVAGIPNATRRFPDLSSSLTRIDQFPFALGEHSDAFRARKGQAKRVFVIKTLRAGSSSNPNFESDLQQKILRHGDLLASLTHDNVDTWCGIAYGISRLPGLVMEYHNAGSLVKRMGSQSYSNEEKLSWVKQIASGMRYLHRQKPPIIHGDLRASNIFLNSSGKIVITDIGMVYITDTPEFTMMQSATTARWTAPELMDPRAPRRSTALEGPDCTTQSDAFAFSMTIVQIFSEALPFRHVSNDTTCIFLILRGERPEIPQYIQNHRVLEGIVKDCWARDPSKRPPLTEVCWRLGMGTSS